MNEAKVNLTPGSKVWVRSVKKVGMVIRVEWDRQYGPQYLVSLHDAENIEDTHPYIQRWFKSKDVDAEFAYISSYILSFSERFLLEIWDFVFK